LTFKEKILDMNCLEVMNENKIKTIDFILF
jgi:hypothetical protein